MRRPLLLVLTPLTALLLFGSLLSVVPRNGTAAAAISVSEVTQAAASAPEGGDPAPTVVAQLGGPLGRVAIAAGDDALAYAGEGPSLTVLDVVDGAAPLRRSTLPLPGLVQGLAVSGTTVMVVDTRLRVIDVSDPDQPQLIGTGNSSGGYQDVAVGDGFAFATAFSYAFPHGELDIYDVRDPAAPVLTGTLALDVYAYSAAMSQGYAYVANGTLGLRVVDVSNPAAPVSAALLATQAQALHVAVAGDYAFVVVAGCVIDCAGGLEVVDISQPLAPQSVGYYPLPAQPQRVTVDGARAYVSNGDRGVYVLNVSDPRQPAFISTRNLGSFTTDATPAGSTLLAAAPDAGLFALEDTAALPVNGIYQTASEVLSVAPLDGLLLAGGATGLRVIDPQAPAVLGGLTTNRPVRGIAGNGAAGHGATTAFLAVDSDGLLAVDVTTPTAPLPLDAVDTPGIAYAVVISNIHAYVADGAAGLRIFDVSNPQQLVEIAVLDTPGQARGVAVVGNIAYVADWDRGVRLIDVTNPALPVELAFYNTPGQAVGVDARGGYVYVADSLTGLRIIDATNLPFLVEVGALVTQRNVLGVVVIGGYVYLANDDFGLEVIDVTEPANPLEVHTVGTSGRTWGVAYRAGGDLYLADWLGGVVILRHDQFRLGGGVRQANSLGFGGVTLELSNGETLSSTADGRFEFNDLSFGTYTVTPTLPGSVFTPTRRVVTLPPGAANVDFTILPPPLTATIPGGNVTTTVSFADTQGLTTTLTFPPDALSGTRTVWITPTVVGSTPVLGFAGHALEFGVFGAGGDVTFGAPVTVAVRYSDADLQALGREASLALYRWTGGEWSPAAESCAAPVATEHDLPGNLLATGVCRSGRFALFGENPSLFLPVVLNR